MLYHGSHWPHFVFGLIISFLASFRFCETQYAHFTTRVFGHSAISLFLVDLQHLYFGRAGILGGELTEI